MTTEILAPISITKTKTQLNITITGNCPSKKNSKRIFRTKTGRGLRVLPSENHEEWHRQAIKQLYGIKPIENITSVVLTFYPSSKRKGDLSNKAESIMDLLVDGGVLEDDNWFVVKHLILLFGAVDPKNPRVEIDII